MLSVQLAIDTPTELPLHEVIDFLFSSTAQQQFKFTVLSGENQSRQPSHQDLLAICRQLDSRIENLRNKKERLKVSLIPYHQQAVKLQTAWMSLGDLGEDLVRHIQGLLKQSVAMVEGKNDYFARLASAKEELVVRNSQVDIKQRLVDGLRSKLTCLSFCTLFQSEEVTGKIMDNLKRGIGRIGEEEQRIEGGAALQHKELESWTNKLCNGTRPELKQSPIQIQALVQELEERFKKIAAASDTLAQRLAEANKERDDLREAQSTLQNNLDDSRQQEAINEETIVKLKTENTRLRSRVEELEPEVVHLRPVAEAYLGIVNGEFENFLRISGKDSNVAIIDRRNELCHHASFLAYYQLFHPHSGKPLREKVEEIERFTKIFGYEPSEGMNMLEKAKHAHPRIGGWIEDLLEWRGTVMTVKKLETSERQDFACRVKKVAEIYSRNCTPDRVSQLDEKTSEWLRSEYETLQKRYCELRVKERNRWLDDIGMSEMGSRQTDRFKRMLMESGTDAQASREL